MLTVSERPARREDGGLGCLVPTQFMSVRETAEYLNMSIPWVYREAPRLGLRPYRFGRGRNAKIQFNAAEVRAWISQQRFNG